MPSLTIFCDESGGTGPGHPHMLVTAVTISPSAAELLMRRFRKKTGITGEIKGHALTPAQRAAFFNLMERHSPDAAVAVISDHKSPLGALARKRLKQHELWAALITESVLSLCDPERNRKIMVMPDHGAARADILERLEAEISHQIAAATGAIVEVRCGRSHQHAGIQVADILANSVGHAQMSTEEGHRTATLIAGSKVRIKQADLHDIRPAWMESKTAKPPIAGRL